MSEGYEVIARRWRPKQFDELVGQDHIVRTLKNAITENRIAHAYLFVGPRGTGKTSMARIFAKALNCEGGPRVDPDDSSDLCQAIMGGSCMDVIEIDGASNNGIDEVRSLREECQYAPAQAKFKIYIIDEVHMLSTQAFNALLKILEEPPAHVKFIFATTESQKVLPTIVSRCQRFEFRPISDALIAERLALIAKTEGIEVDEAALTAVARMANGGMRDAQSILDQLIAFCGKKIVLEDVLNVYGMVSSSDINALAEAMAKADYARVLELIDQWVNEGRDLYRLLLDLETRIRDCLLDAIRNQGESVMLGVPLAAEPLMRMLEVLHEGEGAVRTGLSERVNFEVTLLKAVDRSRTRAIDTVLKELSHLSAGLPQDTGEKKISLSHPLAIPGLNCAKGERPEPIVLHLEPEKESTIIPPVSDSDFKEVTDLIPESTKRILDELFHTRFTNVIPFRKADWIMKK